MRLQITALSLLFSVVLTAQTIDDLKRDTKILYEATYNMSFDTMLDLTHPLVFKFVEREAMYGVMDSAFQNDSYRIRYVYTTPHFSYSEIKTIDNRRYCVVSYENAIRMIYENKIDSDATQKSITEYLLKTFPDASVRFEKDRNAFYIVKNDKLVAITDEFTEGKWKFISFDSKYKELLDAVITENVRKQLGL
jgi:hypothetical protein